MVGTEQSICRSAGSVSSGGYGWDRAMKPKNRRGGGCGGVELRSGSSSEAREP